MHTYTHPKQLECTRLGASDCDSKEVNGGAALLMKYVLALVVMLT